VITHGGHGTLVRALASGCPVLVCPAGGDMAENAARVDWAGVGVRLAPRFGTPGGVRLAVRRALVRPALRARALELSEWARANPGPTAAAVQLEAWARGSLKNGRSA
jgi:UDP:flavonoid glycosyltransferase YjiC (YdhE family)